jgi:hypothetical protein
LRAGGSSAGDAGRACDGGLAGWRIQRRLCGLAVQEHAAAASPARTRPILRFPAGAMGLQRLRDGRTNARGRADPMRADHDGDGRHASARVWRDPARTGHDSGRHAARQAGEDGARLWPTRDRGGSGVDIGVRGSRRRVRGWWTDVAPSHATHLRWDRWRRTSLGASCDGDLP